ncbi:TyeA family type III secretion system gatekeeper subunit [Vibrio sagamiensis]|uniref:SepL/TyeA/HrpJ family type III secretion system gatekeeper n=1 Tax=Vibrio sagamiensis NBRC 104589 TaxID=1219064 RepID=A0A511QG82_9VIBR|nr:TyeA family type III secretion system gatekeeper subunit [Vibrio sagamiensis]PNQ56200.1 TyeA family type III secretion system gatekeeper subunit [Vibrio agarivorans]GEM75462.1 SepL/TyeA/HrpJ family type III secretion system gatekeeper [Vibrio sagamiensis NBRC 104589]
MYYNEIHLMSDIIALIEERWVSSEAIWKIADSMNLKSAEKKISFIRELHNLIRHIPVNVFADDEQRQNLILAAQKALDEAIEQEEEEMCDDELD